MADSLTDIAGAASDTRAEGRRVNGMIGFVKGVTPAVIVSLGCSILCYWSAGRTLGVFLGPVLFAPLIVPSLVLSEERWMGRLSAMVGVMAGVGVVWAWLSWSDLVGWGHAVGALSLFIAWMLALSGVALMLRAARLPRVLCSGLTGILGMVWLTWPVWLSPWLAGHERALTYLAELNPALSVNWMVSQLGLWSSPLSGSALAYKYLTNLNQDVAYPASRHFYPVWLLFGFGGAMLVSVAAVVERRRQGKSQ